MTLEQQLHRVFDRYRALGIVKGGELLLRPHDAVHLIVEIAALGVAILGVDTWHYADRQKGWIVQEVGTDEAIWRALPDRGDTVQARAKLAADFVGGTLPSSTDFVSLILDVPAQLDPPAGMP